MKSKEAEDRIQTACYAWFHNNYKKLRGLVNYNLNNSKNAIDGARNRALGLQAGRSDMTFYYGGRAYFIEFKTPEGRQSKIQKDFQKLVEGQGFKYDIVRSLEEFQELIKAILRDNKRKMII